MEFYFYRDGCVPSGKTREVANGFAGLFTEVFMHLAHDDAETEAIMVDHKDWGAAWRQREFEAVFSPEFRKALEDNHVVLIGWRDMKKLCDSPTGYEKTDCFSLPRIRGRARLTE